MSSSKAIPTEAMLDAGEAAYDAEPEGAGAHRRALGKVYTAMEAARVTSMGEGDAELREALREIEREAVRGVHSKYRGSGDLALENVVSKVRALLATQADRLSLEGGA